MVGRAAAEHPTMNLGELINSRGIVRLETKDKTEALEQLIEMLARRKEVTSKDRLRRAIKDREKILSTGIGSGIAVPHAKIPQAKAFCAVVGVSTEGIPYASLDGKPVHVIVMIAAPVDQHDQYLRILKVITRNLKDEDVRKRIVNSKDLKSIHAVFNEFEY